MVGSPVPRQRGWWRWLPPSASAVGGVGLNSPTGASALPAKLQKWKPPGWSRGRRGEEHLTAGMSFTSAAGSKKKGFVWSLVLTPQFSTIFKCTPLSEHVRHSLYINGISHVVKMGMHSRG